MINTPYFVVDKALVDEISATIILQSYLESKKYQFKL